MATGITPSNRAGKVDEVIFARALTTPIPAHFLPDAASIFNDDIFFWHFYSLELDVNTLKGRVELIKALKALGGPNAGKIKGKYFKEFIPLPVTSNSEYVKDLLQQTMRRDKGTDQMLPNSDAMFGMVLHTYEDSWSHAGFQMPLGHGYALCGGHAPDIPWIEPERATEMAHQVYLRLQAYAKQKYGITKPAFEWNEIKGEVTKLMEFGKAINSEKYQKGDKAAYLRDVEARVKNWQQAIKRRFGTEVMYGFRPEKDATKDEWFGIFKGSIPDIKPPNAPYAPTIKNIGIFTDLLQKAYDELDARRAKILPPGESEWISLVRNALEMLKKAN